MKPSRISINIFKNKVFFSMISATIIGISFFVAIKIGEGIGYFMYHLCRHR